MQVSEKKEASAKAGVLGANTPEENKPPPSADDDDYSSATKLPETISDKEDSLLDSVTVNDSDDSEHFPFP